MTCKALDYQRNETSEKAKVYEVLLDENSEEKYGMNCDVECQNGRRDRSPIM